jgi:hypothetical protein
VRDNLESKGQKEHISLGRWTAEALDAMLEKAQRTREAGARIAFISDRFLGTPYAEDTLIGDAKTPEVLVVNLAAMDCFTFIDYVEAMRLSGSFDEFVANLQRIRYRGGEVDFRARNHFFTDWIESVPCHVEDVTALVARGAAQSAVKHLNRRGDGSLFLPGVEVRERRITYIPGGAADREALNRLAAGDFVGMYTEEEGLDVTHVGIVIRKESSLFLRHASSKEGLHKVIDAGLAGYFAEKPGIVVLRPTPLPRDQAASG